MEKKTLFLIIGILTVAFGIYIYLHPPGNEASVIKTHSLMAAQGEATASKPSMLRMSLIREMVANFRNTQLYATENAAENGVKEDSHSIMFDLDTLKKFINEVENAARRNDPNAKLGLRMYYAAYPLQSAWSKPAYKDLKNLLGDEITRQYERKHTLILIPTIKTPKGFFADFNPLDKSTYQGFPKRINNGMRLLEEPGDTTEVPGLNHGQLIPPKSTEGEGF
ncbi:hypothetical protein D9M68_348970 [compost metagenome]